MNEFKTNKQGLAKPPEIKCVFCKGDLSDKKYREDYELYAWRDDPEDPESLNKLAMTAHVDCFDRFKELNHLMTNPTI